MNAEMAIETVRAYLEIDDTKYEYDEENYEFSFRFRTENCAIRSADAVLLFIFNDMGDFDTLVIMGYTNTEVPAHRKQEMEHLLFNMNCALTCGKWEITSYDEIMYMRYISIQGQDAVLTEEMLEYGINGMIDSFEKSLNTILAVNIGATTADEELHKLFAEEEKENGTTGAGEKTASENNTAQFDQFIIFLPNENSGKKKSDA